MNRNFNIFVTGVVLSTSLLTSSCGDFLDTNVNPNNPLAVPARSILAQALKVTGDNLGSSYNGYAMWVAGYWGKSNTVNGFSEERTYNYTNLYQQGLWSSTYDNLKDYQLIIDQSVAENTPNLAAIARIMRVYNYQLLVDQYGNIPYTSALQGLGNIAPQYDDALSIYRDLVLQLDQANATIDGLTTDVPAVGGEDIVFAGNMANWKRFANTLKLRLLLRMSGVASQNDFIRAEVAKFPATGAFTTTDVLIQPGFVQSAGKQNPFFTTYGLTPAGASATQRNYVQPTVYIINQYKNNADARLTRLYTAATTGPNTGQYVGVQLGDENLFAVTNYSRNRIPGGLLKAYDMPQPLLLLAESNFLQAEAKLTDSRRGNSAAYLAGGEAGAKTNYDAGVAASFAYFYAPTPSQRGTAADQSALGTTNYTTYMTANAANPLVAWDAPGATTKLQRIYYQKYLALNGADPIEAWNELRRNDYPNITPSLQSISPRADKLPVRLLYPQSELITNTANVPSVNQFTSRIFWDLN